MQPGAILGPYDIGTWSRLFGLVKTGALPGVPPASLSFGHVTEVVRAHIAAAERGQNGAQYLLAGTDASMLDLVSAIARQIGKPVHLLCGHITGRNARRLERHHHAPPSECGAAGRAVDQPRYQQKAA